MPRAVYNANKAEGVTAFLDSLLTGSADQYGITDSSYYYVYKFTRQCQPDEVYCYTLVWHGIGCGCRNMLR